MPTSASAMAEKTPNNTEKSRWRLYCASRSMASLRVKVLLKLEVPLDAQQDAVAMQRTERDRLEDEHLECTLWEFNRFRQRLSPIWERRICALSFPVKETATRVIKP